MLVMDAQADLRASVGFIRGRIRYWRRSMLAAVDAHPHAAKTLLPGSDVHIVSNAVQTESLAARPTWTSVYHFRQFDRGGIRHGFDCPCSKKDYIKGSS
jgi:hypothetical protein